MTDGDSAWLNVEGRVRNMLDDEAIDRMLVYFRDVTEQKERTRQLEAIFNGTYQFTGLLEPNGAVIEINETALEFGGFDQATVAGEKFYDAPWWTHDDEVRADAEMRSNGPQQASLSDMRLRSKVPMGLRRSISRSSRSPATMAPRRC
jgi:hypothetical protein